MARSKTAWNRVVRRIHQDAEWGRQYHSWLVHITAATPEGVDLGDVSGNSGYLTGEDLHSMEIGLEEDIADSLNGVPVFGDGEGGTIPSRIEQVDVFLVYSTEHDEWLEDYSDSIWSWSYEWFMGKFARGAPTSPWAWVKRWDGQMEWTVEERNGRRRR